MKSFSSPDIKIFLVGNKAHKEDKRVVSKEEAIRLVKDFEFDYFIETSTKTGMNVEKLFVYAAKLLYGEYIKYKKRSITIQKERKDSNNCVGGKRKSIQKPNKAFNDKTKNIENSNKKGQELINPIETIKQNEKEANETKEINKTINGKWSDYYEWKELIGNGGFGCVIKVKNKKTNEFRAIKIIKNELKESLTNEVNIMEKCCKNNQNSIKIYEKYNSDNEFAIVMELYDCNLKQKLDQNPSVFKPNEIKKILTQLNNTFKIMVDNKIIHRDIKLENILVKNENSDIIVKLADYGISKELMTISQKCQTNAGTILTMAPEIIKEEKYNNKCDLWSIGVIIYQLSFKEFPFNADTGIALLNKIKSMKQKYFKKIKDSKLDDLIGKLLIAEPSKRLSWKEYFEHPFFG